MGTILNKINKYIKHTYMAGQIPERYYVDEDEFERLNQEVFSNETKEFIPDYTPWDKTEDQNTQGTSDIIGKYHGVMICKKF